MKIKKSFYFIIKDNFSFLVQVDGKKKRSAKEIEVSSDEEDFSQTEDEEEEGLDDNNYSPNISEDDDGSDSDESWEEEENGQQNSANAERKTSLLESVLPKEVSKKRKVTPIKIKKLAAKKQKVEKPKTPRKKKEKKSAAIVAMDYSSPQPSTSAQPASTSIQPVTHAVTNQKQDIANLQGEKQFDPSSLNEKKAKSKDGPIYNDKNVDYNLYSGDPNNVVCKKIKIDKNILVTCRMMEGSEGAKKTATFSFPDYAALSFLRKMKDEKAFEFNLPLGLAPSIIEALQLIINDNPKFFKKN